MTIYIVDLYDAVGCLSFQLTAATLDEAIEYGEAQANEFAIFKETLH